MFRSLFRVKVTYVLLVLFAGQLAWWLSMQFLYHPSSFQRYFFNVVYGNIAVVSFCSAWVIAHRNWGGWQSSIGRMLMFLGLGLFMEWLGILAWFYYNLSGANVPYPSFADVGYFGLIPMYIAASILLARATGVRAAFRARKASAAVLSAVLLIPLLALGLAFWLFIRKVGYSGAHPLALFFNLGYPIGEIIPITVALIVLVLSTKMLTGGVMKSRVLWLIFAFFMQFIAEYVFLYQAGAGTYQNANISDMLYATSYLIMGLSIVSFHNIEV